MTLEERAKEFVSKVASGTSREMDYYANTLVEFANETTKELEKENAELKERADKADLDSVIFFNQLCKAKEIIKMVAESGNGYSTWQEVVSKAEQFLNSEVEK